jgi:hypothetical protein
VIEMRVDCSNGSTEVLWEDDERASSALGGDWTKNKRCAALIVVLAAWAKAAGGVCLIRSLEDLSCDAVSSFRITVRSL